MPRSARLAEYPASYDEALLDMLSSPDMPLKIGIEAAHLTVARKEWLERTAASRRLAVNWTSTERVIEQLRLVKDERGGDVARSSRPARAGRRDGVSIDSRGVTERDIAAAIDTDGCPHSRLRAARLRHDRGVRVQRGAAALPRRDPNPEPR